MKFFILIGIFTCGIFFSSLVSAQPIWYGRQKTNSISLDINKPFTPSDSLFRTIVSGFDALSGSVFITGKYALNTNISLVADFPISHGNINDTLISNGSETIIGNPYLGAEFDVSKTPIYFQLGLRLPFVPDDNGLARIVGIASDINRSEAFQKDLFPLYGAINYETVSENKILLSLRSGLNVWFNSDTLNFESNPSVIADYSIQTGYIDKNISVLLSGVGRYYLSSGARFPEKKNVLQYGLSIIVPYKNIRPAVSFRIPGNESTGKKLNYVIGLDFLYLFM